MMYRARIHSILAKGLRFNSSHIELPRCINEINDNPPPVKSKVNISGWVSSYRVSKNVAFVDVVDGTATSDIKCVIRPPSLLPENLRTGSSVSVSGIWSEGKGKQKYEVSITKADENNEEGKIEVLGPVEELYPLQKKGHTNQFLRTIPEYRWRTQELSNILRFRSRVESSLMQFFDSQNFYKTHPPLITSSDCEGAGELFNIENESKLREKKKFFGKSAFMTVSAQLHLEVLAGALSRVWSLTPCFRAEQSDTNRHLAEFWMLEVEIAFINDVRQLTTFSEIMIKHVVKNLLVDGNSTIAQDILMNIEDKEQRQMIQDRWNMLVSKDNWDVITYTKAIEILQTESNNGNVKFERQVQWGDSLGSEHEKWLSGVYFKGPVFVTDYPKGEKPFYMKVNPDGKTVGCYDLLVPDVGELIGGSMREHDLLKLKEEIKERNMDIEPLGWYLKTRENGSMPHGGFGMGFERLLLYLSGRENIRDVIPFPRSVDSCPC